MRAVVVAGSKKSGKTALITMLADALERDGKRVAIVKYSNHSLDKGNTDAFWMMRPDRVVVNASPEETAVFWPCQLTFEDITSLLRADVLLCEGGDVPASVPRILCVKEGEEGEDNTSFTILATYGSGASLCGVSHFMELDPHAAERMVSLILEKAAVV